MQRCNKHKKNRGFSIVELIVVIAIMAILAAIAIPTFSHLIRKANEAADIQFMHDLERAMAITNAEGHLESRFDMIVRIDSNTKSIEELTYIGIKEEDIVPHIYIYHPEDGQPLSDIIDWNYKFKALDSVTKNPKWKQDSWKIEAYTPPDPTAPPGSYD